MALPLYFPDVEYLPEIPHERAVAIEVLCALAQAPCLGVGAGRLVVVLDAVGREPWIRAELGGKGGVVEIGVPPVTDEVSRARWALGALAYSPLFDPVARAAVRGRAWARIEGQ